MRDYDVFGSMTVKHKCPQCKKIFFTAINVEQWGYTSKLGKDKYRTTLCSYRCLRAFEKPYIEQERKRMFEEFTAARQDELMDLARAM